ncbi:hypothetical protein chiPu_0013991 [Chiloscyllium punctatum]|uniref:Secreted protein n=1 Tax=Chiloscyllium punctatum TaxID=137246 RepID=A0A401SYW3_CHIPU|nr:hypothetical protein [Chiloscyllium punctatum]
MVCILVVLAFCFPEAMLLVTEETDTGVTVRLQRSHLYVGVVDLFELLHSFLRARLSAAVLISFFSLFEALAQAASPSCVVSCKPFPGLHNDIKCLHVPHADVLVGC